MDRTRSRTSSGVRRGSALRTVGAATALTIAVAGCLSGSGERDASPPDASTSNGPTTPGSAGGVGSVGTRVDTSSGDLRGRRDGDVVRFDGVRYARAPVGDLRWAPPVPLDRQGIPTDARRRAAPCPQPDGAGAPSGSEDCLRLNLTAPAAAPADDRPRPVMVWFPGGGFTQGDAADYDPRRLVVREDVIVVTANYRLGALGQMAPPAAEDGGTHGLADQQEVLRWVRDNAAAFGGDADDVTVFGQSAGGSSVCFQLSSPAAQGLMARAIIQSAIDCGAAAPPYAYGLPAEDAAGLGGTDPVTWGLPEVRERSSDAATRLGCDGSPDDVLVCLRQLPAERLLALNPQFARPAVGGRLLPRQPAEALEDVTVPVLAGYTRDESRFYAILAALQGAPDPPGSYETAVRTAFGDRAPVILRTYPRSRYADDATAWSAVYTDSTFACPQLRANDALSVGTEVYAYEFGDRTAPPPLPLLPGAPAPGAAHTGELPYLFDVATQPVDIDGERIPLSRAQERFSTSMIGLWGDFARTGTAPVAPWDSGHRAMDLSTAWGTAADPPTVDPAEVHHCDLWN